MLLLGLLRLPTSACRAVALAKAGLSPFPRQPITDNPRTAQRSLRCRNHLPALGLIRKEGSTQNVNIPTRDGDSLESRLRKHALVSFLSLALLATVAWVLLAQKPAQTATSKTAQQSPALRVQPVSSASQTEQTPQQLQQLVAPIALYPDRLVAQILAAATFPEQVVEADRWLQAHTDLTGDAFTQAVDQQPWDSSVKALTAVPAVLGNMDKNLSWTSSLGETYSNEPGTVLDAVQAMRQRAKEAGTLKTTPQETVAMEDSNIAIEPANADAVYVPQYNPWLAYGSPVDAWPDWSAYPVLVRRIRLLFRFSFRNRLFRCLSLGLASLGFRSAPPIRNPRPR